MFVSKVDIFEKISVGAWLAGKMEFCMNYFYLISNRVYASATISIFAGIFGMFESGIKA